MVNSTPMRDLVQFIAITTDPNRLEATRELVKRFGHKFSRQDDGYQVHGVVTHIIDRNGRWRANFYGLEFQPTNAVVFINALSDDAHKEAQ